MQTRYTDGPGASLGATQLSKCHMSQSLSSPSMTENNSSGCRAQAEYHAFLGETGDACAPRSEALWTVEGTSAMRSLVWDFEHQLQLLSCVVGVWCLNFSEPTCLVRTRLSESLMCAVHTGVTQAGVKGAYPFQVL